jgi:hypothetical protein
VENREILNQPQGLPVAFNIYNGGRVLKKFYSPYSPEISDEDVNQKFK